MSTLQDAIIENLNFANDPRNCELDAPLILYLTQPDGSDLEVTLPTTWAVCDVCRGEGKHVNPSIDAGGLAGEDFAEDPDFAEEYFAGTYDQTCNKCGGRTTVRVVDFTRMSAEHRTAYQKQLREEASHRAEHLAEISRGA